MRYTYNLITLPTTRAIEQKICVTLIYQLLKIRRNFRRFYQSSIVEFVNTTIPLNVINILLRAIEGENIFVRRRDQSRVFVRAERTMAFTRRKDEITAKKRRKMYFRLCVEPQLVMFYAVNESIRDLSAIRRNMEEIALKMQCSWKVSLMCNLLLSSFFYDTGQ